jgi:hypothetical protein
VGFVVEKMALGQVFPRVIRFFPVNFIPPVLYYSEKRKTLIIFITGLHNKPEGCGASVASAAGSFTKKKHVVNYQIRVSWTPMLETLMKSALFDYFNVAF